MHGGFCVVFSNFPDKLSSREFTSKLAAILCTDASGRSDHTPINARPHQYKRQLQYLKASKGMHERDTSGSHTATITAAFEPMRDKEECYMKAKQKW